jgi:hypothetical protein
MSRLLLRNVFLGGIGVVAVSASAMAPGSSSPAKSAENPDASFVHKAGANDGCREVSVPNRPEGSRRHA